MGIYRNNIPQMIKRYKNFELENKDRIAFLQRFTKEKDKVSFPNERMMFSTNWFDV